MKLRLAAFLSLLALAGFASTTHSSSAYLSWNDCGGRGSPIKTFTCDSNDGADTLVVSFVLTNLVSHDLWIEAFLSLTSDQISPWGT